MQQLRREAEQELHEHIFPFWIKLMDQEHGGFYGKVDFDLNVHKRAPKGGIVTSRFLWTFASAYRITGRDIYLQCAEHAYGFLVDKLTDGEHEGIYWMVDAEGNPLDDRKHVYAQSFAIYALSELYRATGREEALDKAKDLYRLIETKGFNPANNAYKEEFTRDWRDKPNEMLSENGVMAEITTNTHLHVLEAYTNLYRAWPDNALRERLDNLVGIFYEKIYDRDTHFLNVFFDANWNSLLDMQSYGHDIEASWLIDDALKALRDDRADYRDMVVNIAYNIGNRAILPDGSLANESVNGHVDETKIWWVQAEAIVGFLNAYEHTRDERFLEYVDGLWSYVKANVVDRREGGEWYWSIAPDGKPSSGPIADPWKANYHNGRCCLEIIERVKGQ